MKLKKGDYVEIDGLLFQYEVNQILVRQPGGKTIEVISIVNPNGFTKIDLESEACWYIEDLKNV